MTDAAGPGPLIGSGRAADVYALGDGTVLRPVPHRPISLDHELGLAHLTVRRTRRSRRSGSRAGPAAGTVSVAGPLRDKT